MDIVINQMLQKSLSKIQWNSIKEIKDKNREK
jgi:hypothetical protein